MSQAYYRTRRKARSMNPSNKDRYWGHRAIAFQLDNIGQIENMKDNSREVSSHWKEMFDQCNKDVVLKKKMTYRTEKEAMDAICQWRKDHPSDMIEMVAYICTFFVQGKNQNLPILTPFIQGVLTRDLTVKYCCYGVGWKCMIAR